MGLFSKAKSPDVVLTENRASDTTTPSSHSGNGKEGGVISQEAATPSTEEEPISQDAQAGVQAVEAAAQVWTKWHLTAAYALYV